MIHIGTNVEYVSQLPAVSVQDLPDLPLRILVISAVDQVNMLSARKIHPNLRRTVDVPAPVADLDQFVHFSIPPSCIP